MSVAEIRSTPFSPSGGFEHLSFGNAPSEILHSFLLKYLKGRDIAAFGLSNKFLFQHVFYDVRIYKRLFQDFFPHSFAEAGISESTTLGETNAALRQAWLREQNAKSGNYLLQTHACEAGQPRQLFIHNENLCYLDNREIKIWDFQNDEEKTLSPSIASETDYTVISTDKDYLFVGSKETAIIFHLKTLKELTPIQYLDDIWSWQAKLIHKNQFFFGAPQGSIYVYNLNDIKARPMRVRAHTGPVTRILAHNDLLFTASEDKTIKIWNIKDMSELGKLEGCPQRVRSISVQGNCLVCDDGTTMLSFDLEKTSQVSFEPRDRIVDHLLYEDTIFSPAGSSINMLSSNALEPLKTFVSPSHIYKVAVYDRLLLAADNSWHINIWQINPSIQRCEIYSDRLEDCSRHFVVHKGRCFSSSRQGQIKIWDFNRPPAQEIVLFKQLNLISEEDFSQKLQCGLDFLPKVGIYSDEDLKVLGITPDQAGIEKLHRYVNQKGLLTTWEKYNLKGIYSLSDLPEEINQE